MDILHQSSIALLDAIIHKSELNLKYFANIYQLEFHASMESTLYKLQGILQQEFKVFEVVKKVQYETKYTLYSLLQTVSKDHNHVLENTKSAHEESLISHLVGALLIATNDALNDKYGHTVLVAICALFHDIGKLGTMQPVGSPKNQMTAFYFHAEMGSGIMQLAYTDNQWISKEQWQHLCMTINFHMCTYHSHHNDLKQQHQIATKQHLPMPVRELLYYLSLGDMYGRFPRRNLDSWAQSRIKLLEDNSKEYNEYFNKYRGKGVLIQIMGMSAMGKSTLYKLILDKLTNDFNIQLDDILYIQRDDYVCSEAAIFAKLPVPESTPTFEEYRKYHEIYKTNKLGDRVNQKMKNDIQLGLMENKIIVLDTVAVLFQAAQYILPDIAYMALKINIFIIRDKLITQKDADRLGLPLKDQLNLHGDHDLLFWMHSDFRKKSGMGLFRRRQMVANFYNASGMTKALLNKDSPLINYVVKWGFESILNPMFLLLKTVRFDSTSTTSCLYDFDLDLCELLNKLEPQFGFQFVIDFFKGLNINVAQPLKDTTLGNRVILIKYRENCRFWKAKWARQARGAVFVKSTKNWVCIKSLLQRGAEVLTGIHQQDGVTDSQDYHIGKYSHLDLNQQKVILKFMNKQPINGILSCKIDGSLLGVSLIPKNHPIASFVIAVLKKFQIKSQMQILHYALDNCDFIPIFSSQGTVQFNDLMEDWYFSAFLVGVCNINPAALKSLFEDGKSIEQVTALYAKDICDQLALFIGLNTNLINNEICCLSFESCCPNRQSHWGPIHSELALSYSTYLCKFLGCSFGIGDSCGDFKPHLQIKIPTHWKQPTAWEITNTKQVMDMVVDIDSVIYEQMTISDYYTKYPPICPADDFLDFEGFVFYDKMGESVDYSKIKTLVYYHAHNPNKKTIDILMKISDKMATHIPSVQLIKSYFGIVNTNMIKVKNALFDELRQNDAKYCKEMNLKAQKSYVTQTKETQKKMIINNSNTFLIKTKEIFGDHFEHMTHVEKSFLKTFIMKMAVYEEEGETIKDIIKNQGQILFDLYIEIMNSESKGAEEQEIGKFGDKNK